MTDSGHSNGRWKIYFIAVVSFIGAMCLVAFLLWLIVYSGFFRKEEIILGTPLISSPPLSLEERLLDADVIARVKMRSVSAGAEVFDSSAVNDGRISSTWAR